MSIILSIIYINTSIYRYLLTLKQTTIWGIFISNFLANAIKKTSCSVNSTINIISEEQRRIFRLDIWVILRSKDARVWQLLPYPEATILYDKSNLGCNFLLFFFILHTKIKLCFSRTYRMSSF